MPFFHILFLAVIQGITEFLPISSSGHLLIFPVIAGWKDQGLALDISVHIGTLVAVVVYFWRDIRDILMGFFAPRGEGAKVSRRLAWNILIATIPVVIIGGLLYHLISEDLRSILLVAATTIIFGLFLGWADKQYPVRKELHEMSVKDALIIGVFQVLSVLPGTSRSGITMTAGRIIGLDRTDASHFSMLLSIPTILGAGTLAVRSLIEAGNLQVGEEAVTGAVASCIVALAVISLLMRWIERIGFMPFVIYRLLLGILLLALYFAG